MAAQDLFDTLSGAFGHPLNRPGIDTAVANSQALNGLRTAQTNDAMLNAQLKMEELAAHSEVLNKLKGARRADGTPFLNDSEAELVANELAAHHGDFKSVLEGLHGVQTAYNNDVLSDPDKLGTREATAAAQANTNKVPEVTAVPDNYYVNPGMPNPTVLESPLGKAKAANQTATANNKNTAANVDPGTVAFEGYKYYKSGVMPPMGMQAGPLRAGIMKEASNLADREAAGEDITNPAFEKALANKQDFAGATAAVRSAASGTVSNQSRAINNAVGHLQLMEQLYGYLQQGDVRGLNSIKNAFEAAFGKPEPTNLLAAAQILGPELNKILVGTGTGTGEERQGLSTTIGSLAASPEQGPGAIHTIKGMLGRQAADLAFGYHGATGRNDFAAKYFQPDVATYLGLNPDAAAPPSVTPPAPKAPTVVSGQIPEYNSVEEAQVAGHQRGDKVKIGGVTGTLK